MSEVLSFSSFYSLNHIISVGLSCHAGREYQSPCQEEPVPISSRMSHAIPVPCGQLLVDSKGNTRKKQHRRVNRHKSNDVKMSPTNWSVAGTSQWQYPEELMVTDINELRSLDEFIYRKVDIFLFKLSFYTAT